MDVQYIRNAAHAGGQHVRKVADDSPEAHPYSHVNDIESGGKKNPEIGGQSFYDKSQPFRRPEGGQFVAAELFVQSGVDRGYLMSEAQSFPCDFAHHAESVYRRRKGIYNQNFHKQVSGAGKNVRVRPFGTKIIKTVEKAMAGIFSTVALLFYRFG